MVEPQRSILRFEEASLGRDEPKTNRTGGKARKKTNRHLHGEVLLDNADAVIDALQRRGNNPHRWESRIACPEPVEGAGARALRYLRGRTTRISVRATARGTLSPPPEEEEYH